MMSGLFFLTRIKQKMIFMKDPIAFFQHCYQSIAMHLPTNCLNPKDSGKGSTVAFFVFLDSMNPKSNASKEHMFLLIFVPTTNQNLTRAQITPFRKKYHHGCHLSLKTSLPTIILLSLLLVTKCRKTRPLLCYMNHLLLLHQLSMILHHYYQQIISHQEHYSHLQQRIVRTAKMLALHHLSILSLIDFQSLRRRSGQLL